MCAYLGVSLNGVALTCIHCSLWIHPTKTQLYYIHAQELEERYTLPSKLFDGESSELDTRYMQIACYGIRDMFCIDLFPANCCNDIHLSTVSCSKAATPNGRHFGGIGQL